MGSLAGLVPRWQRRLVRQVLKKIVRLRRFFLSPPLRSSDFAGPRRASALWIPHSLPDTFRIASAGGEAVREREHRRAGEGDQFGIETTAPDRLSVITKMFSWPVGSKDEGAAPEIDSQIDPDITPDITLEYQPNP